MNTSFIEDKYLPELLRLNNMEVPHVNALSQDELQQLIADAAYAQIMADEYAIAGYIIAFEKGAPYGGFNFNWFSERYDRFLYIDRIIVNANYRGQNVGKSLYRSAESFCRDNNLLMMCCEVNVEPRNPISHQFHNRIGFAEVEVVKHPEGKDVMMYRKPL